MTPGETLLNDKEETEVDILLEDSNNLARMPALRREVFFYSRFSMYRRKAGFDQVLRGMFTM